jgi:hypothetical protein
MFKIHRDAKRWSDKLLYSTSPFKTQFDIYYLSFIVGIGLGRSVQFEGAMTTDITRDVPKNFLEYRYSLAGLLLVSGLNNAGLPLNKTLVKSRVQELLDSHSQSFLSEKATELMNCFAFAGFEAMREEMPRVPEAHDFLIWYHNVMLPKCFQDDIWNFQDDIITG